MKKFSLEINSAQAKIIVEALDFYSRIQSGQLSELTNVCSGPLQQLITIEQSEDAEQLLGPIKKILFPNLQGQFYGITNKIDLPDSARVSYDIKRVIRGALAWDRKPEGDITVDFDKIEALSKEPLPVIKKIED